MIRKRTFLALLGIGGALASVGVAFRVGDGTTASAVARLIREELHFLDLDEQGVRDFAEAFAEGATSRYRLTLRGFAWLGVDSQRSGRVADVVRTYLLSTDFFNNQMDEGRTVRYVAFYNPYKTPCVNPFSVFANPQEPPLT